MADRRAELREDMTAAHDELLKNLDSLNTDDWKQATYEGWDRKDTFAHLASIQARQRARIQSALDGTPWNAEDVNTYNARKVEERKDWTTDQVRDEYEREQAATLALLGRMSDADLQRTYQHEVRGPMTVESVFVQVATHTRNHANDIMAATQGATP
jgi:DinB superfamily